MDIRHLAAIGILGEHMDNVSALAHGAAGSSSICTEDASASGPSDEAPQSDEEDSDVLLVATLEDGRSWPLKATTSCCFFTMSFEVASLDPTVDLELALLKPDGQELSQRCHVRGLRATDAFRLVQIVEELALLQWSNLLQAGCSKVRPSFQLVPPVAGLQEILFTGASRADLVLPEGFADNAEFICWYYDLLCSLVELSPAGFMECISITEVLPSIYCVQSTSDVILASIFLRFQEYYECPANHIRRHCFSLEDYKSWCRGTSKYSTGFCYYTQWSGFNIPSWVLDDVQDGALGTLHARELALLESIPRLLRPCYVIGALSNDTDTLHHELAHGLFGTRPDYREETLHILQQLTAEEMGVARAQLLETGYADDEDILLDEMQAYMVTGDNQFHVRQCIPAQITAAFKSAAPSLFHDE
mmetsp:Transcript_32886/g.60187  ORF Transcript_32886/g.60187 Transcript_32886/m.60187 type:complete len:418 (-) Transcript_32886:68-1321(-)